MNLFAQTKTTKEQPKSVNPTRLTVGNVAVQATKDGTNYQCLTMIVNRKLTINKPMKGLVDLVQAGIFNEDITKEAKLALNQFYMANPDKAML